MTPRMDENEARPSIPPRKEDADAQHTCLVFPHCRHLWPANLARGRGRAKPRGNDLCRSPGQRRLVGNAGRAQRRQDRWSAGHARPRQEQIRTRKKSGPLPAGGITVVVRGGTYFLPKTLEFGPTDSGTAAAPIVYRAAEGERARIFGGRPITGFVPYRGSILKADVAGQGFTGFASANCSSTASCSSWPAIRTSIRKILTAAAGPTPTTTARRFPGMPTTARKITARSATRRKTPGRGAIPKQAKYSSFRFTIIGTISCRSPRSIARSERSRWPATRRIPSARAIATTSATCSKNSIRQASGTSTASARRSISGRQPR